MSGLDILGRGLIISGALDLMVGLSQALLHPSLVEIEGVEVWHVLLLMLRGDLQVVGFAVDPGSRRLMMLQNGVVILRHVLSEVMT